MAVKFASWGNSQFVIPSTGAPASGYKLYTYVAGSSTPVTTYTTSAGSVAQSNPIVLNSAGFPTTGQIWITEGTSIKIVFTDANDVVIKTEDNIPGVNDAAITQDQWVASGLTPTYVSATSFTLAGDQTSAFHVGRRLKTSNSGGTVYSTILSSVFGASTTIVVQNDSGTLDSGLSAVSYGLVSVANTSQPAISSDYVCQGRLTLTSGTPVTTGDVTGAETVYFTPFRGNKIDLYNSANAAWERVTFSELSIDVPDAAQMNDVFVYLSSGVLTADVVAWTNDTTRATALVTQNGVLVKSGAVERRYIGSFYSTTTGNGQTEDSVAKRYVWNYYNRVPRPMRVLEATNTWTYTSLTYQQANASAANQLDMVIGVSEDTVTASVIAQASSDQAAGTVLMAVSIGADGVGSLVSGLTMSNSFNLVQNTAQVIRADFEGYLGSGKRTLVWLEASTATGTTTWGGDFNSPTFRQSGIMGRIWA